MDPVTPAKPTVEEQMAAAKAQMQQEMPQQMQGTSVNPVGWLRKALLFQKGKTQAITDPFTGNIYYDPEAMQGLNQEEVNNTLAHELTHTQQVHQQPWWSKAAGVLAGLGPHWDYPKQPGEIIYDREAYQPNPDELAAFQTEHDRSLRKGIRQPGDIALFPERVIKGLKDAN